METRGMGWTQGMAEEAVTQASVEVEETRGTEIWAGAVGGVTGDLSAPCRACGHGLLVMGEFA